MQGLPLDTQPISTDGTFSQRSPTSYRSRNPAEETVVSFEELKSIVTDSNLAKKHVILEARPEGRWKGTDPEPRAGLSSGHVPGSVCLPFNEVLTEGNTFKSAEDVKELLEKKGVDINADQEYIVMCGSGVTACVVKTALEQVLDPGKTIKVYDGSWTEWAQRADNSLIVKE